MTMTPPVQSATAPVTLPASGKWQEWQALDECHQQVLRTLDTLHALIERLDNQGVDATARALAKEIVAFFTGSARTHHADEERIVFPSLLQSNDAALIQHVKRLQQDHGWLEEDWLELQPPLEAISQGYSWYDLDMLRTALPVFAQLYLDHIDLEESLIYPEARRRLADREQAGEGRVRHAGRTGKPVQPN